MHFLLNFCQDEENDTKNKKRKSYAFESRLSTSSQFTTFHHAEI